MSGNDGAELERAELERAEYPRPQLVRDLWASLDGEWDFAFDAEDRGLREHWQEDGQFDHTIIVPFAPESPASGIGDTAFHRVVWYRRLIGQNELEAAGFGRQGESLVLHFGAVDYEADVWVDGVHVGHHTGGQTAFSFDIATALSPEFDEHTVVVRAQDDPLDVGVPRGKQDWQLEPHAIWYHRTTGIWRTVWLEAVPSIRVSRLAWTTDVTRGCVRAELELSARPSLPVRATLSVFHGGESLAEIAVEVVSDRVSIEIALHGQQNGQGYEDLLWTPETPTLLDATVVLSQGDGTLGGDTFVVLDTVESYLGLRSAAAEGSTFLLNDRPFYIRSALEQGYWPESHFTPPSVAAMRDEVELAKRLGFNSIRIHQKVEDPRFLYWCDRLGLTVWGETASAYEFSATAVQRLAAEWAEIVRQYSSHPSIITWVPLNESWGVQHIAHDPAQKAFSLALVNLTRALDPTRPVISNDGWEHTDSDMWTIHDYEGSGPVLTERYGSQESIGRLLDGMGPAGRRMRVLSGSAATKPILLTEFGGVSFDPAHAHADGWGYTSASGAEDFEARVGAIMRAVTVATPLTGFCYTQLTDTRQETNGLCDEFRVPKLPEDVIRALILGS